MKNSPTSHQADSRTAARERTIRVDSSRLEEIAGDARRLVYKLQVSDVYDWDDVIEDAYQLVYSLQRMISR